jgi:hypothetical protein
MLGLGLWVRVAGLRCGRLSHHIPQLGGREAIDCDAAGRGGGLEDDVGSGRDVHGGDAQNGADTLDFDDDLVWRHARSYGFAVATARRPRPLAARVAGREGSAGRGSLTVAAAARSADGQQGWKRWSRNAKKRRRQEINLAAKRRHVESRFCVFLIRLYTRAVIPATANIAADNPQPQ